ncbi:MAG: hypothetical protein M3315_09725 [Actinomycetota bacterium]|nr:hypothetical protein [Actinomycetota bacterium]
MASTAATQKEEELTELESVRALLVGLRRGEVLLAEVPAEGLVFEAKTRSDGASHVLLRTRDAGTGKTWTQVASFKDAPRRMANAAPLKAWRVVDEGERVAGAKAAESDSAPSIEELRREALVLGWGGVS